MLQNIVNYVAVVFPLISLALLLSSFVLPNPKTRIGVLEAAVLLALLGMLAEPYRVEQKLEKITAKAQKQQQEIHELKLKLIKKGI